MKRLRHSLRPIESTFLAAWLIAVSLPIAADYPPFTGNWLLSYCSAEKGTATYYQKDATCHGYIEGISQASIAWEQWGGLDSGICRPDGVTTGQLVRVVLKYLEANPSELHKTSASLVLNALGLAFPCEKHTTRESTEDLINQCRNMYPNGDERLLVCIQNAMRKSQ